MNKKLIRKMLTAAGGPLRIKFTPEQIALFESQATRVPGMNNSGGNRYREEGVLALQYLEQEAKRKEEEIKSRMEMKPVLVKKASKLGEKDLYKLQVNTAAGVVSPVDPAAEFFMYGNPTLKGTGALFKTGLLGAARYAPKTWTGNYGRLYFVGNAFKNSFNGTIPTLTSQATSLLYQPVKLNEFGLTSLKFFERKPARISEAERAGVPKGERNLTISERDYPVGTAQLYIRRGAIAKMDDASRYASEMFKKGDFERVHLDETIRIPDKFSPDGYHLHAKTKRNYYFSKTDPYANNRLKGNWKNISKYNDREGDILGKDLPKEFYDYLEQIKNTVIHPSFTNLKSEDIVYPYKRTSLFGSKTGEIKANEILSKYVRDFRLYLGHLGYNTSNISDYQILLLLTDLYKMLTKSMSGKTKGQVFWHEGPKYNEVFDFSHTGENTGNMGALGPGNYFSSGASAYGNVSQPYLITGIKETPVASLSMIDKGLIPEYVSPSLYGVNVLGGRYYEYLHALPEERLTYPQELRELYENALAKAKERVTTTPIESSRLWIDPALIENSGVAPRLSLTKIKPMEFMLRRNTGIKSLFPHPSIFTKDANGRIIINRNWEDLRVNYKQGGKMNILEFLKNGSGIHIKKKNRGKFREYCGGEVTDECIRKAKASGNPTLVKRATFADNARHFKHRLGGNIVKMFKLRRYLEGGLTTNNKFDYGQAVGVALDAFSTILLNKAVDASIKNLKALTELLKKKLFYNNYKSLLGLQLDRSPIVNLNRAYIQANNMSDVSDIDQLFLNQEQELLNLKLKNTSRLISSIGGLALSYFSNLGNKNQISTTGKNNSTSSSINPTSSPIGKTYTTEITKPFNNTADEWRQLIIN